MPRYVPYTANKDKNTEIGIFAHITSPTLKKRAFGNILLNAPSCGLRREAKSVFFLTEFMPFEFEYNSNFD